MDRMLDAWPEEEKGRGFDFRMSLLESDTEGRTPDTFGFDGQNSCFLNILKKAKLANVSECCGMVCLTFVHEFILLA